MCDIAFTIEHDHEDTDDIPREDLLKALKKRVATLEAEPEEMAMAFGVCDTYEID